MNLARPGASYSQQDEAQTRSALEQADGQNIKVGSVLDKIFMRDTEDGTIRTVVVTSGALVVT